MTEHKIEPKRSKFKFHDFFFKFKILENLKKNFTVEIQKFITD